LPGAAGFSELNTKQEAAMEFFFEIHQDLPREGPGDNASTRKALALFQPYLPEAPAILDVGCGPGVQTRELARRTGGMITAVDTHQPFLDRLQAQAAAEGLGSQIVVCNQSMKALDFPDASFDAIWSEGAIYIMGFAEGLAAWRRLLKPGGCIAVTEASWLQANPPEEIFQFWKAAYPGMRLVSENLQTIDSLGYRVLGHFTLPESCWLQEYYAPLLERVAMLQEKYQDDAEKQAMLDEELLEVDLYRKYSAWYGYEFYVMQLA
jgi:ubiquinone/menaquinone biosynthesis C-methylase UbiE